MRCSLPRAHPPAIIERMTAEVRKALDSDALKDIWAKNGSATPTLTGPAFRKVRHVGDRAMERCG